MPKGKLLNSPLKAAPLIPLGAKIVGGVLAGFGLGALAGGGRDKYTEELRQAQARRDALMQQYENYEFQYTNPFEDMTVNLQASQLQQQGLAQQQADILENLRQTGGAGAAALATGLARQAAKNQAKIAAELGQQEQAIELKQAQADLAGEQAKQQFELQRLQTMLGMSMEEVAAINQAEMQRKQNRTQLISAGIGAVGQLGSAYLSGLGKSPKPGPKPGGGPGIGPIGGGSSGYNFSEIPDMSGITIGYDGPDFGNYPIGNL